MNISFAAEENTVQTDVEFKTLNLDRNSIQIRRKKAGNAQKFRQIGG